LRTGCLITNDHTGDEDIRPEAFPFDYYERLRETNFNSKVHRLLFLSFQVGYGTTKTCEVGDLIIVRVEPDEEEDNREWAPARIMKITKQQFDVVYYTCIGTLFFEISCR